MSCSARNKRLYGVLFTALLLLSGLFSPSPHAGAQPQAQQPPADLLSFVTDILPQRQRDLWVMRVDGHTDVRPIFTAQFRSNWELSAARAISVVQYLISRGVSPQHLVAAGFGEFQPLDTAATDAAYSRNRRIELKLTER